MDFKETKLQIYSADKLIDVQKLREKEPELFDDLCKDYPLEDGIVYMYAVKKDKK